jgi:hypothetical protein
VPLSATEGGGVAVYVNDVVADRWLESVAVIVTGLLLLAADGEYVHVNEPSAWDVTLPTDAVMSSALPSASTNLPVVVSVVPTRPLTLPGEYSTCGP